VNPTWWTQRRTIGEEGHARWNDIAGPHRSLKKKDDCTARDHNKDPSLQAKNEAGRCVNVRLPECTSSPHNQRRKGWRQAAGTRIGSALGWLPHPKFIPQGNLESSSFELPCSLGEPGCGSTPIKRKPIPRGGFPAQRRFVSSRGIFHLTQMGFLDRGNRPRRRHRHEAPLQKWRSGVTGADWIGQLSAHTAPQILKQPKRGPSKSGRCRTLESAAARLASTRMAQR